jgi:hypothetical protein
MSPGMTTAVMGDLIAHHMKGVSHSVEFAAQKSMPLPNNFLNQDKSSGTYLGRKQRSYTLTGS